MTRLAEITSNCPLDGELTPLIELYNNLISIMFNVKPKTNNAVTNRGPLSPLTLILILSYVRHLADSYRIHINQLY